MKLNNNLLLSKPNNLSQQEHNTCVVSRGVVNRFFAFLEVANDTSRTYTSGIKQFFNFLGKHNIKYPVREDVIAFKKELAYQGKKPATIALYLSSIRRFFTWCESENIYPNITAGIKSPKQDKGHKRDYFSGSQIKSILNDISRDKLEGLRNYAIMLLISTGGLRTIEIARANVEDIRNIAGTTCLYIQGKGRTDKKDFVKLAPKTEQAIKEYLKARGHVKGNAPLFASCSKRNNGQRLTTRSISRICKTAMLNAGFNSLRLTAHSLRHSAITLSIMGGLKIEEVQQFARHSSINTTMIYNHAFNRMKSLCENTIERAIFSLN